jgi:hypothetical protein
VFLRIDPSAKNPNGSFTIVQRDHETGEVQGGATYVVQVAKPAK